MVQVINDPNRGNSPYLRGISSALEGLISHKTNELAQRTQRSNTASGLQQLLNIPAHEAHNLAALDPQLLEHVVKSKLSEPSRQAYAQGLQQILGGANVPSSAQMMSGQNAEMENVPSSQGSGAAPESQIPQLMELNEKQAGELATLALKKQKMTQEEKKFQHQLKKDALAETKEIRKDLFSKKKAAQEAIESINRLEELEKEGLPTAGWNEFVKNAGLDIPALSGAPAEEYNKVAANFIRNAKAIFGSRLTDKDIEYFLKTVPSLANSPEGRKRINANLKRIANLDVAAVEAYNDIVKKNDGIPPLDLDVQLDEALDKKREVVYKKFKEDLEKEVPAAQNKLITTAGSVAGSVLGKIGKAAPGAIVGGRVGGLPGAITGGALSLFGGDIFDFLRR